MILIDANLLIYAINSDTKQHKLARKWLESTLSGNADVGFPWVVLMAFIRVTTHHRILPRSLSCEQALAYVDGWLAQPQCCIINPGKNHWSIFQNLLSSTGTVGNLSTDAHIAALALENGATVYSADYDFMRFPGLQHVNPLH